MSQLIVFDWDGTLADSVSKIIECKHFLANKYNLPLPTEATVKGVLGRKFEEAMAECFPSVTEPVLQNLMREFHDLIKVEGQDT